jgi:hypothetical protein
MTNPRRPVRRNTRALIAIGVCGLPPGCQNWSRCTHTLGVGASQHQAAAAVTVATGDERTPATCDEGTVTCPCTYTGATACDHARACSPAVLLPHQR